VPRRPHGYAICTRQISIEYHDTLRNNQIPLPKRNVLRWLLKINPWKCPSVQDRGCAWIVVYPDITPAGLGHAEAE
jgi:hypothetical protein